MLLMVAGTNEFQLTLLNTFVFCVLTYCLTSIQEVPSNFEHFNITELLSSYFQRIQVRHKPVATF